MIRTELTGTRGRFSWTRERPSYTLVVFHILTFRIQISTNQYFSKIEFFYSLSRILLVATASGENTDSEYDGVLESYISSAFMSLIGNDEAKTIIDKLNSNEKKLFKEFSEAFILARNYEEILQKNKDELIQLDKKLYEAFYEMKPARVETIYLIKFLLLANQRYSPSSNEGFTDAENELANKALSHLSDMKQNPANFSKFEEAIKFLKDNRPEVNKFQDKLVSIRISKEINHMDNLQNNFLESYATLIGNNKNREIVFKSLTSDEARLFQYAAWEYLKDKTPTVDPKILDSLYQKIDRIFSESKIERVYLFTLFQRVKEIIDISKSAKDSNIFHWTTEEKEMSGKIENHHQILNINNNTNNHHSDPKNAFESIITQKDKIDELFYKTLDFGIFNDLQLFDKFVYEFYPFYDLRLDTYKIETT